MRDYGMFTNKGNAAVSSIVDAAISLKKFEDTERVWNFALNALESLGELEGCEEATDTAVREAVYNAVI